MKYERYLISLSVMKMQWKMITNAVPVRKEAVETKRLARGTANDMQLSLPPPSIKYSLTLIDVRSDIDFSLM